MSCHHISFCFCYYLTHCYPSDHKLLYKKQNKIAHTRARRANTHTHTPPVTEPKGRCTKRNGSCDMGEDEPMSRNFHAFKRHVIHKYSCIHTERKIQQWHEFTKNSMTQNRSLENKSRCVGIAKRFVSWKGNVKYLITATDFVNANVCWLLTEDVYLGIGLIWLR